MASRSAGEIRPAKYSAQFAAQRALRSGQVEEHPAVVLRRLRLLRSRRQGGRPERGGQLVEPSAPPVNLARSLISAEYRCSG